MKLRNETKMRSRNDNNNDDDNRFKLVIIIKFKNNYQPSSHCKRKRSNKVLNSTMAINSGDGRLKKRECEIRVKKKREETKKKDQINK